MCWEQSLFLGEGVGMKGRGANSRAPAGPPPGALLSEAAEPGAEGVLSSALSLCPDCPSFPLGTKIPRESLAEWQEHWVESSGLWCPKPQVRMVTQTIVSFSFPNILFYAFHKL